MARKGDIDSKPVSARVPMEVFIRLQTIAYQRKKTMSAFLCEVLSDENFGQGGQTKIEHRDKINNNSILIKEIEMLRKELSLYGNFMANHIHIQEVDDFLRKNNLTTITFTDDEFREWVDKQYEIIKQKKEIKKP